MADDGVPTNPTPSFEAQKLEIERQKLEMERRKIKWTAMSVSVPVLAAIATIAFGFWSVRKQGELNFQLEAAKSVMQAPSLEERLTRARFFSKVFPKELPPDFFQNPDVEKMGLAANPPNVRIDFLKLLASKGLTVDQTEELWTTLFPNDDWAKKTDFVQKFHQFTAKLATDKK
jgi:hypothetical protein